MKTKLMALAAAVAVVFGAWAAPTVTDITAKQRYPWNGLVDIACKVLGIEADAGGYEFAVVAVDKDTGKEYTVSNFSIQHNGEDLTGLDIYENGDYSLLWNAREDMGQVVIERMTVRITLEGIALSVGKVQLWEGGPDWADRNIGASSPEDAGLYFWWGDTKGHRPSSYGRFGFSFVESNYPMWGKSINTLQSEGWVVLKGGTYVLAPKHDAAHVRWGGGWRMPTSQELEDLNNKCDWTWKTVNGVNGYIVRGRGAYAFNSIFLPAAGYGGYGTSLNGSGLDGSYWSSVPSSDSNYSRSLDFYWGYRRMDGYCRYCGFSVRPVQGSTN